jgi:hypothetical protein
MTSMVRLAKDVLVSGAAAGALLVAVSGWAAANPAAALTPSTSASASSSPPADSDAQQRAANDAHGSYPVVSSSYTIKGDGRVTVRNASCADGYYVRTGPPTAWDPLASRNPSLWIDTDNTKYIKVWSTTPEHLYGNPADADHQTEPFRALDVTFYSETPYTHHFTFTWWCDALSPWYNPATGRRKSTAPGAAPDIEPPEPWGPDCYYCNVDYDVVLNDGNDMVMNNAGARIATGNPVISWPNTMGAHNQQWHFSGLGFHQYLPAYGIWTGKGDADTAAIVEEPNHVVSIRTSSGTIPDDGAWYYLDGVENAIGPDDDSIMLVNEHDDRCLAASPDQGAQLITLPCNTWDKSEWWTVGGWKK